MNPIDDDYDDRERLGEREEENVKMNISFRASLVYLINLQHGNDELDVENHREGGKSVRFLLFINRYQLSEEMIKFDENIKRAQIVMFVK